jgi:Ca-activated chloride channel family protein
MSAIRAALAPSDSQDHMRIVCFLTDGEVGNDLAIIGEIQKHPNARVFAYGIGNSVNRFLITSMAKAGRGDSEVVTLNEKADVAAHRLYLRLRSPVLTDVSIDWHGLPVTDVYPKNIPDLFTGKPLVLSGRYTAAATGSIVIHGKRAGEDFTREIPVHLNSATNDSGILPAFWARRKIDDLMSQDWAGLETGKINPDVQKEITQLGLSYKLMTQFTSFVAVEQRVVTTNGKPQRVEIPVEMPEGVSYEGVFGGDAGTVAINGRNLYSLAQMGGPVRAAKSPAVMNGMAGPPHEISNLGTVGSGSGGGIGSGSGAATAYYAPAPPPPASTVVTLPEMLQPRSEPEAKLATDRTVLESKLSPAVLDRFDCWKKQQSNCKSAPEGAIQIQVVLTDDSAVVVDQLKALGLEIAEVRKKERTVIGRLPIEKLTDLAKMEAVKFVTQVSR